MAATLGLNPFVILVPKKTKKTTRRSPSGLLLCGRYEIVEKVSQGSYGEVYKARDTMTGQIVAVKQWFDGSSVETQREIKILASLPHHPSIVEYCNCPVDDQMGAYVVMEYLETDLRRVMELRRRRMMRRTWVFSLSEVKRLMRQLLEGVELLHKSGVMHRDLKPSNILVDESKNNLQLKIGDFGMSRFFNLRKGEVQDSQTVGTLRYKAPELLLGARKYSCAIDMWSVGCIVAELLLNKVLFQGHCECKFSHPEPDECEFSQLARINALLGDFSNSHNLLPSKFIHLTPTYPGPPMVTPLCVDLITELLKYDPKQRITATQALHHPWFNE